MTRIVAVFVLSFYVLSLMPAHASTEEGLPLKQVKWPFDGVYGSFNRQAIQRGYQVYKEVCAACHSMKLLSYRNLMDIGFSEAEAKAIAAEATVEDGPNDDGDMFDRPGRLSDKFASPFPNEQAARSANGGALPPDLSLIAKARMDGPNYIYALHPEEGIVLSNRRKMRGEGAMFISIMVDRKGHMNGLPDISVLGIFDPEENDAYLYDLKEGIADVVESQRKNDSEQLVRAVRKYVKRSIKEQYSKYPLVEIHILRS